MTLDGRGKRNKGLRGEREVFHLFENAGAAVLRLEGQGDNVVELADVIYHVESKRQERIEILKWCRQAEAERARPYFIPLVVFRPSREPWRVTLPLDAFLEIVG